jgi:hypothetical protein
VLVRADLSPSQQVVQSAHAVLEASRQRLIPPEIPHPHLVVCGVADHEELTRECERLAHHGVRVALFTEPDILDAGARETAVATEPITPERRRLFRRYRLLGARG